MDHHRFISVLFTVLLILFFFTLLNSTTASALTYSVGGKHGSWVPNPPESYSSWAKRSRFRTGDSLLFKYKRGEDSVLVVEKNDYYTCNTSNPLKKLDGGDSVFTFDRSGPFFFISGQPGHCKKDQKFIFIVMSSSSGGGRVVSPVSPPTISPSHPPSHDAPVIPSPDVAPSPHATTPVVPSPHTPPSPSSHVVMSPPAYATVPSSHVVAPSHAPSAYAPVMPSSPSHAAPTYAQVPSSHVAAPVYPPAAYVPVPSGYAPSQSPLVQPPATSMAPTPAPVVQPPSPQAAAPTYAPQPAAYAPQGPGPAADVDMPAAPTTPLVPAEAPPKKTASLKSVMTPAILVLSSTVLVLLLNVGFGIVV